MRIVTARTSMWIGGVAALGASAVLCLTADFAAAQTVAPGETPPTGQAAQAQGRQFGAGRRPGRQMLLGGAARRLGLTDAQKDQLKTIAQSHRDEWRALADRMRTARAALVEATTANPIDEGAIRQRSAEVAAVSADIAVARARGRAEMIQVLTPEQQAQLETMRSRVRDRMASRRQRQQ